MNKFIASIEYDPIGFILFKADPRSKKEKLSRRLSRTATLDGKSSISDMGYTASDATIELYLSRVTELIKNRLEYLVQSHSLLNLYIDNKVYLGAIQFVDTQTIPSRINFIVKERLN
jgi:hypothetical protein